MSVTSSIAVMLVLLAPASANASGPSPFQRMALRISVETTIVEQSCPTTDYETSCTGPEFGSVVYIAGNANRWSVWHELGHQFDYRYMTNADRGTFLYLTRQQDRAWRSPPNSPNEQFAEAFMACVHSAQYRMRDTGYGYQPTPRQHRHICRWLNRVAARTLGM